MSTEKTKKIDPVTKGFEFEKMTVKYLTNHGLKAWRTNKANEADLKTYKAGLDAGVDIIATFSSTVSGIRDYAFYIQCKCHETDLEKSAISEVYAGRALRKADIPSCIPVVISTCNATEETRQYAKDLGVELFLNEESNLVKNAKAGIPVEYSASYGYLLRVLLYDVTGDDIWIKTIPVTNTCIPSRSSKDLMMQEAEADFNQAQSLINRAIALERSVNELRQKSIDIQKAVAFRVINNYPDLPVKREKHSKDTPTIDMESG